MDKKSKKLVSLAICLIIIGFIIFNGVLGKKNNETTDNTVDTNEQNINVDTSNREMPVADGTTDEITRGVVVSQDFVNKTDNISEIELVFSRIYYLEEKDSNLNVVVELLDGNKTLIKSYIKSNDIPDQHRVHVYADSPVSGYVGKTLTLKIYEDGNCDTGVVLMKSGKDKKASYYFGDKKQSGSICFSIIGE